MKKILSMLLVLTITISLVACGGGETESKNDAATTKKEQTESTDKTENTEENESSDDIKYADMIPDPEEIFKNGTVNICIPDGGDSYMVRVYEFTEEEGGEYVERCKNMGFTYVQMDNTSNNCRSLRLFTDDKKYSVYISLHSTDNYVDISCKKSDDGLIERLSN